MRSRMVRVDEKSHEILRELAQADGSPMQEVLAQALEEYRRNRFLKAANAAYAALRRDPRRWPAEQKERAAWDATLRDTSSA